MEYYITHKGNLVKLASIFLLPRKSVLTANQMATQPTAVNGHLNVKLDTHVFASLVK